MFIIFLAHMYTDGYLRSLFYDISQILIASELVQKMQKKTRNFTEKYGMNFFVF